ncbi:meiosis protein SPO22/ZIP4 like domain-containing protein [Trichoderma austrokoningii]
MPPEDAASALRIRKVQSFIDFAALLQSQLSATLEAGDIELLIADTGHRIQQIHNATQPGSSGPLPSALAKDAERKGQSLWNLCVRLRREQDASKPSDNPKLVVKARSFAFNMLELGRSAGRAKKNDQSEAVYLVNLALRLGKICIEESDLDLARSALQKAAELVERLKAIPLDSLDPSGQIERTKLEAEYLALRAAMSWKEDKLDVAEHMFGKIDLLSPTLDVNSAEIIAGTLQHIGYGLASKGDHDMAVKWLKRAHDIISRPALDQLSVKGLELRLAICQGLVRGLLDVDSQESIREANNLIECIESEIGDKPLVLHWRLELLQKAPGEIVDIEAYSSILHRMIRSFDYSDASFIFLLYHIKNLRERNHRLARGLLDELLLRHVITSRNNEWVEDLHNLLDKAYKGLSEPLESDIAGAAHSKVIWNKIESIASENPYDVIETWCSIALHTIFMNSGEANQGRFSRKLIMCALDLKDTKKARRVFSSMPDNVQNHFLTRYLTFKMSLIDQDHELGCESIQRLSELSDSSEGRDILYACIREAQQAGDRHFALAALQAIIGSWKDDEATPSNLPSILRCSIRLIQSIEEESNAYADDLCCLFEKAAECAKQNPQDGNGKIFTVFELHWFRKNAYNLGVLKCEFWDISYTIRIFKACLAFPPLYPGDLSTSDSNEIATMAMRCHFVVASALVSIARTEDQLDEHLQKYLEARRHVGEFDAILETKLDRTEEESSSVMVDSMAKLSTLLVFDFEAATVLKDWDGLNEIVRRAKICKDEVTYKAMGDCMLRSKAPGRVMFSTMQLIIDEIFELQKFDYEKLMKYIRCMFQVILGTNDVSALQLVDQALQIAGEANQIANKLPSAEVEWLVATTFNHGIDYYARGESEACHTWALKAIDLAGYVDDGGVMRTMLHNNFSQLQLGGK